MNFNVPVADENDDEERKRQLSSNSILDLQPRKKVRERTGEISQVVPNPPASSTLNTVDLITGDPIEQGRTSEVGETPAPVAGEISYEASGRDIVDYKKRPWLSGYPVSNIIFLILTTIYYNIEGEMIMATYAMFKKDCVKFENMWQSATKKLVEIVINYEFYHNRTK